MAKRKNLNGLPHNLTMSYFGTMRYHSRGYMSDWLANAAKALQVAEVHLDILNGTIDPKEMEKLPLQLHLQDLKIMLHQELINHRFLTSFIVDAKMKIVIPDPHTYARTIFCYTDLIDKEGRHYRSGRIIIDSTEAAFDPFVKQFSFVNLWSRVKKFFERHSMV